MHDGTQGTHTKQGLSRRAAILALTAAAWGVGWAQAAEPLQTIRIGIASAGVGSNPIRFGGSTAALAYTDGVLEDEFKKDGVKVEWIFFKGAGPAVNEALVNKQLDFAYQGDLPSIVHRASGVKTKIILGSAVRTGLYLAVPPDSPIQRIEDIKGKKVGLFKGTNLHLAAVRALADKGIQERDVKFVNLDFAAGNTALVNKDVDAVFSYVGLFELRDKGLARIVWSAAADSYKYTRHAALLVTDDFAARYPEAVQRVVNRIVQVAHRYTDENRRAELFALWGKAEYPEKIWREEYVGQPLKVRLSPLLDTFLVSSYQESARVAQELKLVRGKPEIKSWFDDRYLKAALKAQKLENHWPAYGPDGQLLAR